MKLILFDFDDTLYLKRRRCFIRDFETILKYLQNHNIACIIVTCNYKAYDIIQSQKPEFLMYIKDVIYVNANYEYKSHKIMPLLNSWKPSEILFFDNDPFHVYDVSKNCNVRSFIVHPDYGVELRFINLLLNGTDIRLIHGDILSMISRNGTFLDRYYKTQNLSELEKMIDTG